jgi:ABC-type phosphate transport system auxiliary subunit
MRDLLERQLQLFRELDARQEDVRARRDRLVAQLRTLSLQLAHLRAQSAMDSATAAEITGRIHALVRSIDHRIEGVKETRELLSP